MYNFKKLALVTAMSGALLAPAAVYAAAPNAATTLDATDATAATAAAVAVAAETIADGTTVVFSTLTGGPVAIGVDLANDGGSADAVSAGVEFFATYSIGNGTFATAVSVSDLDLIAGGAGEISGQITDGGAIGDSFVTFRVIVDVALDDGDDLLFQLPNVNITDASTSITGAASITVDITSGIDDVTEGQVLTGGAATTIDLLTISQGLVNAVADGASDALITVTDRDEVTDNPLGAAGDVLEDDANVGGLDALLIGTLTFTEDTALVDTTNTAFGIGAAQPGVGSFTFTVSTNGSFDASDRVLVDWDGDEDLSTNTPEDFTMAGDTFTYSVSGSDFLAKGGLATPKFYYVNVAGVDLAPSSYTVDVDYAYTTAVGGSEPTDTGSADTEFDGLDLIDVHPNFVMNTASSDLSFIRVTSGAVTGTNSIFINVYGADGTDFGLVEFTTITSKETLIIDVDDLLATVAPTYDTATNGNRAFVEVWTSNPAVVLPVTRTNDVLTNMSQSTLSNDVDEDGAGADTSGLSNFD